jgi:hypothetical protein
MKVKAVLLLVGLSLSTIVFAEELSEAKKAAIKELTNITGSAQIDRVAEYD